MDLNTFESLCKTGNRARLYFRKNLKIVKCSDTSCSSGNTITTVDSTGIVGGYSSITIGTDGLPVISYYSELTDEINVAKCDNPFCILNWTRR
jgi:hypothetical protein